MALRGVGPESEAESVRFNGRRVTRVGPEVKHGRRRLADAWINLAFSVRLAERYRASGGKTTKDQTIQKRTEPAFIEPMQCKPVTALPAREKWAFEMKFDWLPLHCGVAGDGRHAILAPPESAWESIEMENPL